MNITRKFIGLLCGGALAFALGTPSYAAKGDTLRQVKAAGHLNCNGHNGSYLGFAEVDDQGQWKGFDVDLCRTVATAIFGDWEGHLNILPVSFTQRWTSLQSSELDVLIKASDWTMGRDAELGVQFSNIYMMAPIKILAYKELGAQSAKDLDGGTVCTVAGSSTQRQMAEYAQSLNIKLEFLATDKTEEYEEAYLAGRCDAIAQWDVQLALVRLKAENPDDHVILPDVIEAAPLSIIVREGDDHWVDLMNFALTTLLAAEQNGITSQNVDEFKANPPTPSIGKMLGATPGYGSRIGLDDDFGYNIIKKLGNYDEMWERNLGAGSPYGLARGINALWQNGGILWPIVVD